MRLNARRNQPHDLFLQKLSIAAAILVPDDQIYHQAFEAPVSVCFHELPNQVDIGGVTDLQQNNWQVARNGIAPEARLGAPISH